MGRPGINYEAVAAIADNLIQQQSNPTIESVRYALGGTGSHTTISKHLNAWRSQRLLSTLKDNPEKITPPDPVNQAVNHVWAELNAQAQAQTTALKQDMVEKLALLSSERQQLQEERDEALNKLAKAQIRISQLSADNTLLQQALTEEKKSCAVLTAELASQKSFFEEFKGAHHAAQDKLQNLQQQTLAQWQNQSQQLSQSQQQAQAEFRTSLENQRVDFMVKIDALQTAKDKIAHQFVKTETALQNQVENAKIREEQLKSLVIEAKIAGHQYQEVTHTLSEREKLVIDLKMQLAVKEQTLQGLQQQLEVFTQLSKTNKKFAKKQET